MATIADAARTPIEIRLINDSEPLVVADDSNISSVLSAVMDELITEPTGVTPICKQIRAVGRRLKEMEGALRASGKIALLVIMSDGESTDGNIADVLRPLEGLPLQVIVRICTSEKEVGDFWQAITAQLNLDIFVLSQTKEEAMLIAESNSWLVYGEALHRLREFGVMEPAIDLLRYRQLSHSEIATVAQRL